MRLSEREIPSKYANELAPLKLSKYLRSFLRSLAKVLPYIGAEITIPNMSKNTKIDE